MGESIIITVSILSSEAKVTMYTPFLTMLSAYVRNATAMITKDERGQDLAEYALLLVFIAIACIIGVTALGGRILAIFNNLAGSI